MSDNQSNLSKPFSVSFGLQLLWVTFILGIANTAVNWRPLVGLLPVNKNCSNDLFLFFISLFVFSLSLWLIIKISNGYNWARNVLFLWFILSIIVAIPTIIEMYYYSRLFVFLSSLTLLTQFVSLSLLFSDSSNAWFKAEKNLQKEISS